jgi:hypothetical protein
MNRWLRTKSYGISTATKDNPIAIFDRYWRRFGYVPCDVQETLMSYFGRFISRHPRYKHDIGGNWSLPPNYVYTALPPDEKLRCKYRKARDYSHDVCERWVRRYKQYLKRNIQGDRRRKIEERLDWTGHHLTKTRFVYQRRFHDWSIEGEYCPVALITPTTCPVCEGRAYVACSEPTIILQNNWFFMTEVDEVVPHHINRVGRDGFKIMCYNSICQDMQSYLKTSLLKKNNGRGWKYQYREAPDYDTQLALLTTAYVEYTAQTLLRQKNPVNNLETP